MKLYLSIPFALIILSSLLPFYSVKVNDKKVVSISSLGIEVWKAEKYLSDGDYHGAGLVTARAPTFVGLLVVVVAVIAVSLILFSSDERRSVQIFGISCFLCSLLLLVFFYSAEHSVNTVETYKGWLKLSYSWGYWISLSVMFAGTATGLSMFKAYPSTSIKP